MISGMSKPYSPLMADLVAVIDAAEVKPGKRGPYKTRAAKVAS